MGGQDENGRGVTMIRNIHDGENHDEYFDFIYRIYKIRGNAEKYTLSNRVMDKYKVDFIHYNLTVDVDTGTHTFFFDCKILADTKSHHIVFKLAKDFEILNFQINGRNAHYDRFGYFVHSSIDTIGIQHLEIKGKLKSPQTNNQFISMDNKSFFIRLGGFAAIPSPSPGNNGRYFFSDDSTRFDITYTYPEEYTLLQYGDPEKTIRLNGQKQTKTSINGKWMDEIAFYAQKDWEKKEIVYGNTYIGFYFDKDDEKERNLTITEMDTIVQWINKKFNNYGDFKINFVVLNSFVKGGLLNDSHSIISQNAESISGVSNYLHEICHKAPQPSVDGNYLWIKEGFTNFLSFEYLFSQKGEEYLWEDLKREYLHCFDLYEEPLINIRSTSVPTYWAAYSKASWVFRMLETEIGKDNFQKALYKLGTMEGIELKDNRSYLEIFEQVSGKKLTTYEEQWLYRKENPVLTVQGQLEKRGNNNLVKIRISQKTPYFSLPLEVEIKTKTKTYRKTIQIQDKETVFEMPVKGDKVSIKYDPESRLFAIIKDYRKTFTENFSIPKDTVTYVSKDGHRNVQVWFTVAKKRINIIKKDGNNESRLELTNKLSPVSYIVNGDTLFIQDMDAKTIQFKTSQYDIADPVYPEEFIPFLFSIADWKDIKKMSMLYLISGSLECQVIHCELEKISDKGYDFSLKEFLGDEKINIYSKGGFPISFTTLDGTLVVKE
jgi:hypothetical protein